MIGWAMAHLAHPTKPALLLLDVGPNATDVLVGIPAHHLQDLMMSFYKTKVVLTEQKAKQLLLTMHHGYDEAIHNNYMKGREVAEDNSYHGWYHC